MSPELATLTVAAAWLGFSHTLMGPDHYVPFIAMAKARRWSRLKTAVLTFVCGLGHVGSSVVLGAVGIAVGSAVANLEAFESNRGDIAAWILTAFGLVYFVWGLRRAIRNRPHTHLHAHADGQEHAHEHMHERPHVHPHPAKASITPWVLFTIFVFGPCEPLIPLLMYPAATESAWSVAVVAGVFAAVTIGTMLAMVMIATFALGVVPGLGRLERYGHALAGAALLLCGAAIHLGL